MGDGTNTSCCWFRRVCVERTSKRLTRRGGNYTSGGNTSCLYCWKEASVVEERCPQCTIYCFMVSERPPINAVWAIYVLLYRFFFATLLSVYNKWMFSPAHFGFPAPVFVTTIHMVVQFGLAATLRAFWPKKFRPPENPIPRDYVCVVRAYDHLPNLVWCK